MRYQSRRHRFLMDESEQALLYAAQGSHQRERRIARQILGDSKYHRLWESRHANLVLPVAERSRREGQIFELRELEMKVLHRRAMIRSIRRLGLKGRQRDKVFAAFYGPRDKYDAILAEHRQYTLAVSSRVSADHLIGVMHDPVSVRLLEEYDDIYSRYFELYCSSVACDDPVLAEATRAEMVFLRRRAVRMIKRLHTEPPHPGYADFEKQALLARSGRYPVLDYMVR